MALKDELVMFVITIESKFFVRLRQYYYKDAIGKESSLVRTVWLANVPKDLAEKVEDRDTAAQKLEAGEVNLVQNHVKRIAKDKKKVKRQEPNYGQQPTVIGPITSSSEAQVPEESGHCRLGTSQN
ncbi:hypothetical protein AC578_2985 [Pseudocercospora eumusae]|uniref:Uncharacterized protein n=1 Tax=Pseudocercospora eumusae TaxID=321146 RepID=A0A139HED6_9PEZI|nr:hypothetical protein AC578_2985 [Pseudocercospora eumusae]